jgi:hypothetical protein
MRSSTLPLFRLVSGLRWAARLLGAFLVGIVLLVFIGEAGFNPLKLRPTEAIQMFLFLTNCIGLLIAWRWPFIGGAISTGGMLLFFAVEFTVTGGIPKGLVFHLMLLPGILFMLSHFIRRRIPAQ